MGNIHSWKKYVAGAVALAMFVAIGYRGWQWYQHDYLFDPNANPEQILEEEGRKAYFKYYENLEEAYKEDDIGGETPEETLEMFISALEKENLEEASKLYPPEEREEALNSLETAKENGHLQQYLSILKGQREGQEFTDGKTFEFYFFNDEGEQYNLERLTKNSHTEVWKLREL